MTFLRDTQTVQQCSCIALRIPAVHLGKFCLKLRCSDTILIGKIFLEIYSILFLHDLVQSLISHDDRIQNVEFVVLEVILLQK